MLCMSYLHSKILCLYNDLIWGNLTEYNLLGNRIGNLLNVLPYYISNYIRNVTWLKVLIIDESINIESITEIRTNLRLSGLIYNE